MLFEALSRTAKLRPDAPAVVSGESVLTWSQWRDRALQHAETLPDGGIVPLQYFDPMEFLVAILACAIRSVSTLSLPADATPAECARLMGAAPVGSADFLFLPTSGTTGQAKLAARSETRLASLATAYIAATQMTPQDRIFCAVPLAHGYGLCAGLLASLFSGACLYVQSRFDRRQLLRSLAADRITVLAASPFHYSVLAGTRMPEPFSAPLLRLAVSGGAPLPRDIWNRTHRNLGFPIRQTYGSSETGMITANLQGDPEEFSTSVGHPLPGLAVEIQDVDGAPLPPGMEGGIAARDCSGNWRQTEDWGHLDATGRLYVTGRRRSVLSIGGRKFHPAEVEEVLRSHPHVRSATVITIQSGLGEDAHKALVMCQPPCTVEEIIAHCRQHLAPYKVPCLIELQSEQPA